MNIYMKLAEARKIIRDAKVEKKGENTYSQYSYFTPEQVEMLVAKACEETKTICITNLKQDERGYYQTLEFMDLEAEPATMGVIAFELRTERPEIKATNATQQMGGMDTYSERYIKQKVFQIKDNNPDFDSQDNRSPAGTTYVGKPTPYQKKAAETKALHATDGYQKSKDAAEDDLGE